MSRAKITLKKGKAGPTIGRHPWVRFDAIQKPDQEIQPGDIVDVFENDGRWLARGFWNGKSAIPIRLFSFQSDEDWGRSLLESRLMNALSLREKLGWYRQENSGGRLFSSEGDGLSGMTIDRFGSFLVVQLTNPGLYHRRDEITKVLVDKLYPLGILLRVPPFLERTEGMKGIDEIIFGDIPSSVVLSEGDLKFEISLQESQKTGHYFDQRLNRESIRQWISKEAVVLDLFCYSGGFGLSSLKAGASSLTFVDSSASALEAVRRNLELNNFPSQKIVEADVFSFLADHKEESFDVIVCDPPKWAPSRSALKNGLKTYFQLHERVLPLLRQGGILLTSSCSGAVSAIDFQAVIAAAARRTKRDLQLLERRGQSPDHPVSFSCPESSYLKFFACRLC